jgi:hypothetical protein
LLALAPSALAADLKVREVFPGSAAHPAAQYVELQVSAGGSGDVSGQSLSFYDDAAHLTHAFAIPTNVAHPESQRTILLASEEAANDLGIPAPDFGLGAGGFLDRAGGAVCLSGGTAADCVTWGPFPIPAPFEAPLLPDPQSANAAPIGDEAALQRSIARGCPTYLDEPDDTGSSAVDFQEVSPAPRDNAQAPTETQCPPDTAIETFPANPVSSTTAAFTYAALPEEAGTTFKCSLDDAVIADFTDCTAGRAKTYSSLADGPHTFRVLAAGPGGPDPIPASYTWTVDTQAPETTIDSGPPDPSSGFTATFTFHSSEPSSSFRCQLDQGPTQTCSGSMTYINIPGGVHAFRVWAVDNAGNQDPSPAERAFTVDTSIGDLTAPDTSILTGPPNPSSSEDAAFTYASTEQGSSFECRLDGAAFAPCAAGGVSYARLRNGSHTFQVRSTDRAGNVDPAPAVDVWKVAAPLPKVRITKAPPGHARIRGAQKKLNLTFAFSADKLGSTFRCRLDKQKVKPCRSPLKLRVAPGRHRFVVYAIDALGNEGTAKARRIFRVQRIRGGGLF